MLATLAIEDEVRLDSAVFAASFDLLTVDHLDQIDHVCQRTAQLTLAVISDEGVLQISGRLPDAPATERAAIARHLRGVSQTVVTGPETDWALPTHDGLFVDNRLASSPWSHAESLGHLARSESVFAISLTGGR